MAAPTLSRDRLRRLAELRPEPHRVLSVFLNLDPAEFATGAARSTAITSLMNEAGRCVDQEEGLAHDDLLALRADLERVREALDAPDLAAGLTKGVAVFACGPADLLEVVRLPHPVEPRAIVDDSPFVEPLVMQGESDRWCVLLTTRRDARVFLGTAEGFDEEERFAGSQGEAVEDRAIQHTTDRAADQHLRTVGERLSLLLKAKPFDCLLIGASDEIGNQVEQHLHAYVRDRLCGRIHVDVENASADQVREAAAPLIEEHQRGRERAALDRFAQEVGRGGRAVAGLSATLTALNEHRVEVLLFEEGYRSGGAIETSTGMLTDGSVPDVERPVLDERDDIVEPALERAMEQSADVLVVRRFPDLGAHGGIGALLRF